MDNIENIENNNTVNRKKTPWIRPWNTKQFNDLYNRDERFLSILIKGTIAYLNRHIKIYDKGINHFIFNTGSSYMYVESNGYEFSWNETSGEDSMYMDLPRCVVQLGNIEVPQEELSQPFARGNYERNDNGQIKGFNAEIKRIPIELTLELNYMFSNFNEGIIVMQELFDELIFQRYFNIVYLGQIIQCSIEFSSSYEIQLNKIDLGAADTTTRNLPISIKICTNYPVINERTEISTSQIISKFGGFVPINQRSNYIEIIIDGIPSDPDEVIIDLKPYDLDDNNIVDDHEIDIIRDFINRFDADGDGMVTTNDLNIITQKFYDNIYVIEYDLLNKGKVDLQNLYIIKNLFMLMDVNHDNIISQIEIEALIGIIYDLKIFDINNDLKVDAKDLNFIVTFILDHENMNYIELYNKFIQFIKENFEEDFVNYIIEIIQTDLDNAKIAIEYYINENQLDIDPSLLNKLYQYLVELINFKRFDFTKDNVLDKNDIKYMMDMIENYVQKTINYQAYSSIIIHQNDHNLREDSITDIVPIQNVKIEP